jgi:hypothetical protein
MVGFPDKIVSIDQCLRVDRVDLTDRAYAVTRFAALKCYPFRHTSPMSPITPASPEEI